MRKAFTILGSIFGVIVLVVVLCGVALWAVRRHNADKYTIMSTSAPLKDKSTYQTNDHVVPIEGEYLNGFHFIPERRQHPGTLVVFGGSEGSPNYEQAKALSEQGYEVLSLFFFGQPNQVPTLARVPLDQFDEISEFIHANIERPTPITLIGSSKGAEFTAELAAHGYAFDNLVNYAPADHTYAGLDFSSRDEKPSFAYRGEDVPFASFRTVDGATSRAMIWDLMIGRPPRYRETYVQAAERADASTRIDLRNFKGNGLLFAGAEDAMWQSELAATGLSGSAPNLEAFVYPGAGHLFSEDIASFGTGWEIMFGGTAAGAATAYRESQAVLLDRLNRWHGVL